MPPEDVMRFPQITQAIECDFQGKTAFLCSNLDEAVAHCVREAVKYGGVSRLSLDIAFKAEGDRKMVVAASLSTKIPQPTPHPIHVFVDREHRLRSDDPYQRTIDFPRSASPAASGDEGDES